MGTTTLKIVGIVVFLLIIFSGIAIVIKSNLNSIEQVRIEETDSFRCYYVRLSIISCESK